MKEEVVWGRVEVRRVIAVGLDLSVTVCVRDDDD